MCALNFLTALVFCIGLLFGACARSEEPPAPPAPAPMVRVPVPPAGKLAAAEKEIKDIYKTEYAKSNAATHAALAKELLKQAPGMKDDLAAAYVMLREARECAVRGADMETALAAAKALGERFDVDARELEAASFAAVAKLNLPADGAEKAFAAGLGLLDELEKDDRYDAIEKVSLGLESLRRLVPSAGLVSQAADRLKEIRGRQIKWQSVKFHLARLKENPADPDANLAVGRYYAEAKKDLSKALPFLAKGADAGLKALAQSDLADPGDSAAKLALADAWWEAAGKDPSPLKAILQARAAHWYGEVVGELTGLRKQVVEKRIQQASLAGMPAQWVPLTHKEGLIRTITLEGGFSVVNVSMLPASRMGVVEAQGQQDANGHTFFVYDFESGTKLRSLDPKLRISWQALAPDGGTLALVGHLPDDTPAKGQPPPTWQAMTASLHTGAVSPPRKLDFGDVRGCGYAADGQLVLFVQEAAKMRIVRVLDGKDAFEPLKLPRPQFFSYQPIQQQMLVCSRGELSLMNLKGGKAEKTVTLETRPGNPWQYHDISLSPDRRLASFISFGQWAIPFDGILDLAQGKWVQHFSWAASEPKAKLSPVRLTWLPDSRRVAGGCVDGTFRVWDVSSWRELFALPIQSREARLTSDGRFVLVLRGNGVGLYGLPKKLWGEP